MVTSVPVIPDMRFYLTEIDKLVQSADQTETPLTHEFIPGVYCRSMYIPKGTIICGRIHTVNTLNICAKGEITVLTEYGLTLFKAPSIVVSSSGIKKIGYAHEDTIWINIFHNPTDEKNPDVLEDMFSVVDYESLEYRERKQLEEIMS